VGCQCDEERETFGMRKTLTVIDGNIQFNSTDLLQFPPGTLNPHRNVIKADGSIVITDDHTWFETALL
jgi:adenine specific DNA methylase Mod